MLREIEDFIKQSEQLSVKIRGLEWDESVTLYKGINMEQTTKEKYESLLLNQQESIQNDLLCILDGLDNEVLDNVCNVIVERFAILKKGLQ